MAKRVASYELTDRNWDQEEEPEEAGHFTQASKDIMKDRQIIKAKRKGTLGAEGGSSSFTGFSGFSFKPTTTSTPFSFNVKSVTNGNSKAQTTDDDNKITSTTFPVKTESSSTNIDTKSAKKQVFTENLKKLNESVLEWIKKHVEKNPYCILSPIFKDYDKHLAELEKEKDKSSEEKEQSSEEKAGDKGKELSSFGTSSSNVAAPANSLKEGFKFGFLPSTTSSDDKGSESKPTTLTSGFSFKPTEISKPAFSFAVGTSSGATGGTKESSQDDEEDEYVPPKPEVVTVQEEGSLLTKKCKLYYQNEGKWVDRGVGFVHLKKLEDKAQLLVRADTNLGNILLNIALTSSIPMNLKNNSITFVCVPNPPLGNKTTTPATMLIRVKTKEDAESLMDKMNELKE